MTDQPFVSIITPVYNAEAFLAETVASVLGQSFTNWELILIDDCSTDSSTSLMRKFSAEDSRIHSHSLETNQGAAVARNTGLALARGRYIAFIDSDDCWLPDKLSEQLAFMQEHGHAFTYTDLAYVDEAGNILKAESGIPNRLDYASLLKNTAIACSTVIIDREQVGDFRMPLVRKGQDTATWLMLMRERGVVAYGLPKVLNHYRQVAGSISSNRLGALRRTWHTYRHLEQLPLPKALYYFACYMWNAIKRRL